MAKRNLKIRVKIKNLDKLEKLITQAKELVNEINDFELEIEQVKEENNETN